MERDNNDENKESKKKSGNYRDGSTYILIGSFVVAFLIVVISMAIYN